MASLSDRRRREYFRYRIVVISVTANHLDDLFVNASGGPRTITLPAFPNEGDRIRVTDLLGNASTNNITIARNGQVIDTVAQDFIIDADGAGVELVWIGGFVGWFVRAL